MRSVLVLFFILLSTSCYKEKIVFDANSDDQLVSMLILRFNQKDCLLDYDNRILRYSISKSSTSSFQPLVEFPENSQVYLNNILLNNYQINNLGQVYTNIDYPVKIVNNNETHHFTLKFTDLPIVQIITSNTIYDEPKSTARIVVNYPDINQSSFSSYIAIEQRGGWNNLSLPKRSYGFSFLNTRYTDDIVSRSLFDLKNNVDWILDGMAADEIKMKNKLASNIWKSISNEKDFSAEFRYVELFINNEHQGLYCLGETINAEFLGLNNNEGLIYKAIGWSGPPCFETSSSEIPTINRWDGWEQKFPRANNKIEWSPLARLRHLIVDSNDEDFVNLIQNNIRLENFIDYYLFSNFISGIDNISKNILLIRQNQLEPLQIIPFDFDDAFSIGDVILDHNRLYKRLIELNPNAFKDQLKLRWFYLRENDFTAEKFMDLVEENIEELQSSDIIYIENNKWNSSIELSNLSENLEQWMINRLIILDTYYSEI